MSEETETTLNAEDVNVEAEQTEAEKPEYDANDFHRNNIEDEMASRRSQQLKEESALPSLDALNEEAEEEAEEQDGNQSESPPSDGRSTAEQPKPKTEASSAGDDDLHTLIIDGQEERRPLAEVIALAQRSRASDKRFQDAKALSRQANEMMARVQRGQQPTAETQPQQPSTSNDDENVDAYTQSLMYGDEAQVRDTVKSLLQSGSNNQQQLNPTQVAQMTAEIVKEQTEHQTALNDALNEYPEIKEDSNLQSIAVNFVNQNLKQELLRLGYKEHELDESARSHGHLNDWWRAYREAKQQGYGVRSYRELLMDGGKRTREWLSGRSDGAGDNLAEKQNRKAGAAKQPRKVSAATPARGMPKSPTQSEIIKQMREERGQVVY